MRSQVYTALSDMDNIKTEGCVNCCQEGKQCVSALVAMTLTDSESSPQTALKYEMHFPDVIQTQKLTIVHCYLFNTRGFCINYLSEA